MKKEFSFYEFAGVVAPGGTLLLSLSLTVHPLWEFFSSDKFGAGQLGLFLIASYITGHLVQGIGNQLEKVLWAFRGMPSTWIRWKKPPYLIDQQTRRLRDVMIQLLGDKVPPLQELDIKACRGLAAQLYAKLEKEGRTARIDVFNGNYGLFRGIASALLVTVAVTAFKEGLFKTPTVIMATVFFLALMRMHRFGIHYAAELYRQALNFSEPTKPIISE